MATLRDRFQTAYDRMRLGAMQLTHRAFRSDNTADIAALAAEGTDSVHDAAFSLLQSRMEARAVLPRADAAEQRLGGALGTLALARPQALEESIMPLVGTFLATTPSEGAFRQTFAGCLAAVVQHKTSGSTDSYYPLWDMAGKVLTTHRDKAAGAPGSIYPVLVPALLETYPEEDEGGRMVRTNWLKQLASNHGEPAREALAGAIFGRIGYDAATRQLPPELGDTQRRHLYRDAELLQLIAAEPESPTGKIIYGLAKQLLPSAQVGGIAADMLKEITCRSQTEPATVLDAVEAISHLPAGGISHISFYDMGAIMRESVRRALLPGQDDSYRQSVGTALVRMAKENGYAFERFSSSANPQASACESLCTLLAGMGAGPGRTELLTEATALVDNYTTSSAMLDKLSGLYASSTTLEDRGIILGVLEKDSYHSGKNAFVMQECALLSNDPGNPVDAESQLRILRFITDATADYGAAQQFLGLATHTHIPAVREACADILGEKIRAFVQSPDPQKARHFLETSAPIYQAWETAALEEGAPRADAIHRRLAADLMAGSKAMADDAVTEGKNWHIISPLGTLGNEAKDPFVHRAVAGLMLEEVSQNLSPGSPRHANDYAYQLFYFATRSPEAGIRAASYVPLRQAFENPESPYHGAVGHLICSLSLAAGDIPTQERVLGELDKHLGEFDRDGHYRTLGQIGEIVRHGGTESLRGRAFDILLEHSFDNPTAFAELERCRVVKLSEGWQQNLVQTLRERIENPAIEEHSFGVASSALLRLRRDMPALADPVREAFASVAGQSAHPHRDLAQLNLFGLGAIENDRRAMEEQSGTILAMARDNEHSHHQLAVAQLSILIKKNIQRAEAVDALGNALGEDGREALTYATQLMSGNRSGHEWELKSGSTVGVEIELFGFNPNTETVLKPMLDVLQPGWDFRSDPSIKPDDGTISRELVSPIIGTPEDVFDMYCTTCMVKNAGTRANDSCGLHVHLGVRDRFPEADHLPILKQFYKNYVELEARLDTRLRGDVHYAKSLSHAWLDKKMDKATFLAKVDAAQTLDELMNLTQPDGERYWKVNMKSFSKHGTVEVRHHEGTVEPREILGWVRLLDEVMSLSVDQVEKQKAGRGAEDGGLTAERRLEHALQRFDESHDRTAAAGAAMSLK